MRRCNGANSAPETCGSAPWWRGVRVKSGILAAREIWLDLLALLWPSQCVVCGAADRELCASCNRYVRDLPVTEFDGLGLLGGKHTPDKAGQEPVYCIAGPYEGPVRSLLIAFKHRGAYGFVRLLGGRLGVVLERALRVTSEPDTPPLIIAVPSRAKRVRERGYRHVEALVTVGLKARGLQYVEQVRGLRALRGRTGQVGLNAAARELNARRISVTRRAGPLLRGRTVILVDDVVTSGATTRAARETLERAGARVGAVVALCAVPHKNARSKTQVDSYS